MTAEEAAIVKAASRDWFGYGSWSAPYWFLGMEQGGDPEHQSYVAWKRLGGGELLDCRDHHLSICDPLFRRWHEGARPPTQPTWRGLIQILLSFHGRDASMDSVRRYQVNKWGARAGETAVIELSALRARNLSADIARYDHRDVRIQVIKQRLRESRPTFVVCYGIGYRNDFESVAGAPFDASGFASSGATVFALTKHPTSFGMRAEEFRAFGQELKRRVERVDMAP